jgi:hypothetical protein
MRSKDCWEDKITQLTQLLYGDNVTLKDFYAIRNALSNTRENVSTQTQSRIQNILSKMPEMEKKLRRSQQLSQFAAAKKSYIEYVNNEKELDKKAIDDIINTMWKLYLLKSKDPLIHEKKIEIKDHLWSLLFDEYLLLKDHDQDRKEGLLKKMIKIKPNFKKLFPEAPASIEPEDQSSVTTFTAPSDGDTDDLDWDKLENETETPSEETSTSSK